MPKNRENTRPIIAPKFHHTTFTTRKLDEMVAWYEKVAGLTPVHYAGGAAWLTNDEANHRIALLALPGIKEPVDKGHTAGLHHTAFEYADFTQWIDNYVRLRDLGITPFMSLDHGMTISMYYQDPEGNGVEIQFDAFGSWDKSKEWMYFSSEFAADQIGEFFDPEYFVRDHEAGLTPDEMHTKARAGEYRPEVLPEVYLPEAY
ncbi:VOC family protein [Haematomicrobium sanguinis]|uniref:VOC family protein n=1 Tax=Haematomicrobium sanguinis TaxID=479106 RepID=UPI00047EB428|nr:VOC family protein [Haematomicrobium sanguinis]